MKEIRDRDERKERNKREREEKRKTRNSRLRDKEVTNCLARQGIMTTIALQKLLPTPTHTNTHTYILIYTYITLYI